MWRESSVVPLARSLAQTHSMHNQCTAHTTRALHSTHLSITSLSSSLKPSLNANQTPSVPKKNLSLCPSRAKQGLDLAASPFVFTTFGHPPLVSHFGFRDSPLPIRCVPTQYCSVTPRSRLRPCINGRLHLSKGSSLLAASKHPNRSARCALGAPRHFQQTY